MAYADLLGWTGLVSSMLYQLGALPWEIYRNYQRKAVRKISFIMAGLSFIAYLATTIRAALQPDWFDVGSRWGGMVCSAIILGQIVKYDRLTLSINPPFVIRSAGFGHDVGSRCRSCQRSNEVPQRCRVLGCDGFTHDFRSSEYILKLCDTCSFMVSYIDKAPPFNGGTAHYWINETEEDEGWYTVSEKVFEAIRSRTIGATARVNNLPSLYFQHDGITGLVTLSDTHPTFSTCFRMIGG